ncbi:MAG: LysR family transcriptional regulator [Treponema sp.]|jgi:LysR family cyn operon transcriptional activator|nr:LysR family transcriptional regulator [Treponema sp.]
MTDRQLEYILAIAKEGNITGAAQKLNISQPSLSNLLAAVERDIGAKIFDRSLSPMRLTCEGEKYVQTAENILGSLKDLRRQIDDIQDSSQGRLSLGCGPLLSPFVIPVILPALIHQYSGVLYELTEDSPAVLEKQLLSGMLDLIFSGRMINHSAVECEPLYREEMLLFAPSGFKPAVLSKTNKKAYPVVRLQSLGKAPFVLMKPRHQLRIIVERIFSEARYVPHTILETDSWETCLRITESGIAFTILPDARREIKSEKFQKFSLDGSHYRHTFLCYRKNARFSKVMTEFIQLAHKLFAPVPPSP